MEFLQVLYAIMDLSLCSQHTGSSKVLSSRIEILSLLFSLCNSSNEASLVFRNKRGTVNGESIDKHDNWIVRGQMKPTAIEESLD